MLEVTGTVAEMKQVCDGLISRLDTTKEGIIGLEDKPIETSKTEKTPTKDRTDHPRTVISKGMYNWKTRRIEKKKCLN